MNGKDDIKKIQKALMKLYMHVKYKSKDDVNNDTTSMNDLQKMNCLTLIEYIKSSFDIAVTERSNKEIETYLEQHADNPNSAEKYETLLRKEESHIRQHISVSTTIHININIIINTFIYLYI
jgi:hypothetical protein